MKKLTKLVLGAWCLVLGAEAGTAAELPAGYTAVDYIESTKGGGQFIDTGYTANGQTKVEFDAVIPARWEQNDRFGVLFGSRTMNDWARKAFALQMCDGNTAVDTVRFAYNGAYRQDGGKPFSFGERVTVTCDGQHVEWTGSKAASVDFTAESLASSKSTLYIFADNSVADDGAKSETGINPSVMRLYSFMITEGGTLKRNFVPCVRMADAIAGLYDMVEGKFYGNSGSGNFAMSAPSLPFGRTLTSGTYEITESFAFAAPATESALKVADGATVTLNIAAGVTVALRGGDAFEVWGAGAGVEVPADATLKVTGVGKLFAFGGKGANGCNGVNGGNGSADSSTGNFTSGAGGAGGWGGGGAGAGIGGKGASGGGGGNGGKSVTSYSWSYTDLDGKSGDNGGAGKNGGTCGTVLVEGMVKVFAYGGAAGDADGAGGANGSWDYEKGPTYYFGGFGGGGGGGGAKGGAAADIGGGGAGGYGGGGGGSGAYLSRYAWSTFSAMPGWGAGGSGAANGAAGGSSYRDDEDVRGGSGGSKGAAGAKGGNGTLTVADGAAACAEEGRYSVGRLSETVEIFYDNGSLLSVSGGTSSPLSYSIVNNDTGTLKTGWYVVNGTVSRGTIEVKGEANLVLLYGAALTASGWHSAAGISVSEGNTLNIFGVESGSLTAQGGNNGAGIGGGWHGAGGTVTINGGVVTATGGGDAAGIGGGYMGAGGKVTINGGVVTATGALNAAGIGGGCIGNGGEVTINGGEVMATGNGDGAHIGSGHGGGGGSLTIGPRVLKIDDRHYKEVVEVAFEIPQNLQLVSTRTDGGPFRMTEDGASRMAVILLSQRLILTFATLGFEYRLAGEAEVVFGPFFADAVIDASQFPKAVEVEKESAVDYALPNGETARAENVVALYSTGVSMTMEQGGWYVVYGEVTTATIEVHGEANLILADGAKLTVNGGINVGSGKTLNIYGQSAGTGILIAKGANSCAGIGGNGGTITINGGIVTATGNNGGAGIGGRYGAGGTITINGGEVTANGGYEGAGIGDGSCGGGSKVTINGGKVTANGGYKGAGIGGGLNSWTGEVTINGGMVTANGGDKGEGIGNGYLGGGIIVTLGEMVEVVEGATGNGSGYVKIEPVVDVWETEVEMFEENWYVVVPCNTYINTHFKPDSNARVEMKVKVQGASEYWFGCWDGNWDDRAFALGNDGSTVYCGYGSGVTCGGIPGVISSGRVTVALEKGVVYTNGVVWSAAHESDAEFSLNNNLYLFAQNRNGTVGVGGSQGTIICYGCQISTNDANGAAVPVRNFVPARTKDARQIVGLYDTVSGEFYVPRDGTLTLGYDGPTCVGGEIAEGEGGEWIVAPSEGVTEVAVTGLTEGDSVAVPPTVTKVNGVGDAQIKVRSGAYDITGAFTVSGGAITLNENGSVTIADETIPVKPTIGDLGDDAGEPFTVGEGSAAISVRTIPGLKYSLVRGAELGAITMTVVEPTLATEAQMTLTDAEPPTDKAFYRIDVSVP